MAPPPPRPGSSPGVTKGAARRASAVLKAGGAASRVISPHREPSCHGYGLSAGASQAGAGLRREPCRFAERDF